MSSGGMPTPAPSRAGQHHGTHWPRTVGRLLVGLVVIVALAAALVPSLLPVGDRLGREGRVTAALVLFLGSYLALAIGRVPRLHIHPARLPLVGPRPMVPPPAPPPAPPPP